MSSLIGIMNNILSSVDGVASGLVKPNDIEVATIALAFVIICARIINTGWRDGYDRAVPFMKDQASKFLIVCALCMPLPILNGSFVTTFPKAVVTAGFEAAAAGNATGGQSVAKYVESTLSDSQNNEGAVYQKTGSLFSDFFKKSSWKDLIGYTNLNVLFAWGLITLSLIICLLPVLLPVFFVSGPLGLAVFGASALLCAYVGLELAYPDAGTQGANMSTVLTLISDIASLIMTFIFKTVLIFTFYGVMISLVIKSVAYVITFPFALVNMAFENRRQIFIDNVAKGFSLALAAIIAGIMFNICLFGFKTFAGDSGFIKQAMLDYIGQKPNVGEADGMQAFFSIFGWVVRLLIASIAAPAALCIPIIRFLSKSEEVAAGLVGGGTFMGGTGFSQAFGSKIGGFRKYIN